MAQSPLYVPLMSLCLNRSLNDADMTISLFLNKSPKLEKRTKFKSRRMEEGDNEAATLFRNVDLILRHREATWPIVRLETM
jgi:hypothetical protein